MKKKCENCWIGKAYQKRGCFTENQFIICYFQCCFNKEGGNWKQEEKNAD